jgi:antitoxin component of RelBE/YafQ-DinJ toxin-antitoxin module
MAKEDYIMFRLDKDFKADIKVAADKLGLKMSAYISMVMKAKNEEILQGQNNK